MSKANCSCKSHQEFSEGKSFSVYKRSSRKISAEIEKLLIDKNLLSQRASYLCTACAEFAKENYYLPPKEKRPKLSSHYVDTIIELIETDELDNDALCRLAKALGNSQASSVVDESKTVSSLYKCDNYLSSYNGYKWLHDRNSVLINFLKSVTGVNIDKDINNKKLLAFIKTYEQILYCANSNIVLPLSFSCNLVSYFICGSKLACDIFASCSPAGSYYTVLNWIKEASSQRIEIPPENDVITFFDNNQVMARNWRVNFDSKASVSVITNLIHFFPSQSFTLQNDPSLSPSNWMYRMSNDDIFAKVTCLQEQSDVLFRKYRVNFIRSRLDAVYKEIVSGNDLISENATSKVPIYLNANNDKHFDKYEFASDLCASKPQNIILGEPVMANPCSYEAVEEVFAHILDATCEQRQWSIAGCDGSPYILGSRLIEDLFVCPQCNLEIKSKAKFADHLTEHDIEIDDTVFGQSRKFKNLLLFPGSGHIEINMVKCVCKTFWYVFLKHLAYMLGFKTIKAKTCCKLANDHHKSMQIIEIALFGITDELLYEYCLDCAKNNRIPSAVVQESKQ